jgi:RNA polymerase sigma-70 factor (ECF subfamily)
MTLYSTGILPIADQAVEDLFEQVFRSHFKSLHAYACTIMRDVEPAEEIVQNVFLKLWEKKAEITIRENTSAYLYRAVHNESLNYLRHRKVRSAYQSYAMRQHQQTEQEKPAEKVIMGELEKKLEAALRELPEQCRTIFQLSRFEDLKYKEIADKLDLSVKTIENQMGKALRLLRLKLVDFLPTILLLMTLYK